MFKFYIAAAIVAVKGYFTLSPKTRILLRPILEPQASTSGISSVYSCQAQFYPLDTEIGVRV